MVWDHHNGTVEISLPDYVESTIHKYQQPISPRKQHAPHAYSTPEYGATRQLPVPSDDTSDPLYATGTKILQEIVGTLLYHGRAVDTTMLVVLGNL